MKMIQMVTQNLQVSKNLKKKSKSTNVAPTRDEDSAVVVLSLIPVLMTIAKIPLSNKIKFQYHHQDRRMKVRL